MTAVAVQPLRAAEATVRLAELASKMICDWLNKRREGMDGSARRKPA
jgi:hypothetical protein